MVWEVKATVVGGLFIKSPILSRFMAISGPVISSRPHKSGSFSEEIIRKTPRYNCDSKRDGMGGTSD